ncbi:hypothetical protein HAX54_048907 [Datura stramonium]|uniref:Uncharacterized protein n=1 Tax=Datura stramonium TaxID=4076 RepID=A0ABS8WLV6_DATST|nr:hypothetical protein [Datura stramonium]
MKHSNSFYPFKAQPNNQKKVPNHNFKSQILKTSPSKSFKQVSKRHKPNPSHYMNHKLLQTRQTQKGSPQTRSDSYMLKKTQSFKSTKTSQIDLKTNNQILPQQDPKFSISSFNKVSNKHNFQQTHKGFQQWNSKISTTHQTAPYQRRFHTSHQQNHIKNTNFSTPTPTKLQSHKT